MFELNELGDRICIIGPSSGGKSTLAQALSKKLNIDVFHLDQMAHISNTNWEEKDKSLFKSEHQKILKNYNSWIIEGNYSFLMKERFENATSIIWLDFNIYGAVVRYLKRAWKNDMERPGNLQGATKQFNWNHIHFMITTYQKNKNIYHKLTQESKKKIIYINWFKNLKLLYKYWELPTKNNN